MTPEQPPINHQEKPSRSRYGHDGGLEHLAAPEPQKKDTPVDLILSFIQDSEPEIRKIAADRLAALGTGASKAAPNLTLALSQESDPDVARSLVKALVAIGHAGEPALVFMARSSDKFLQIEVIRALGASGTASALTLPALECIMRTSTGEAAKEAGKAITTVYKKPIPANFLQGDNNRFGVEWTKRLYLPPKGAEPAQPPAYTEREREEREKLARGLLSLYSNDDAGVKVARLHMADQAIQHIAFTENERILTKVLLHFGLKDADAGVRNGTLRLLRTFGPDLDSLGPLLQLAMTESDPTNDRAISAVREIKGGSALGIEIMTEEAICGDTQRVIPALKCLGKLCLHPSQKVLQAFRAALDSSDDEVVLTAANSLFEMKPWSARGAVALFVKMLESPNPTICRQGLSSFTEFMFLAANEEKAAGLTELERIVKNGPKDPRGELSLRQRDLITAAAVLAAGSLAVSTTPELQKRSLALLSYAALNPCLDTRRAAYAGLYTIARQSDNPAIVKIGRQSLGWALEDETDDDAKLMIQAYLDNIDPPQRN